MEYILTESQFNILFEKVSGGEVICDNCGWSWKLSEGGDDPYICHKCGYDNNAKKYIGERVQVYYNLHKHTFSLRDKSKVILHADFVKLGDVEFRVREGGKLKVRSDLQKNVHAFVIGTLLDYCQYPCDNIPNSESKKVITYNPYKYDTFVYKKTEEPIYFASEVDMINSENKIFLVKQ
jgi:hypothetical protein